jgi:hypothetical protein
MEMEIDSLCQSARMSLMLSNDSMVPADVLADLEQVCRVVAAGQKPAPALEHRIRECSARIRQEIQEQHGIVDVGADIIREMRDAG